MFELLRRFWHMKIYVRSGWDDVEVGEAGSNLEGLAHITLCFHIRIYRVKGVPKKERLEFHLIANDLFHRKIHIHVQILNTYTLMFNLREGIILIMPYLICIESGESHMVLISTFTKVLKELEVRNLKPPQT